MKLTREQNRFLNRLLASLCRASRHEINAEIYRQGGPRRDEIAVMRNQQRMARELILKLEQELKQDANTDNS